ncbi:MAG: SOS response-associated peptidase, partial [Spirochaetales bacterium]|nr:SOS response-associated peptidase [Spirochaetales bacterium]
MCFSAALTRETIESDPRFSHLLPLVDSPGEKISGFSFPGLPVLRESMDHKAELCRWGLVPAWVKEEEKARKIRSGTLNARWESLAEKPSFRESWPGKRCLVPVEGFFEPHLEEGVKSTWYICHRREKILYLAGIWQENLHLGRFTSFPTFSIITVPSTGLLSVIHNEKLRMPLILSSPEAEKWLKPPFTALREIPGPFDQGELEAWECEPGGRGKVNSRPEW